MEHAPCTLGGVKSDRAHFVGGGRHNLLLRALRSMLLKKVSYMFIISFPRRFVFFDLYGLLFNFIVLCKCYAIPRGQLLLCSKRKVGRGHLVNKKVMCAVRESNPGLVRGRDLYYHCINGTVSTYAKDRTRDLLCVKQAL